MLLQIMLENKSLPPFSCTFTSHVPELLMRLNCSLAVSTYQAGKLLLISAKNENELIQLPRNFLRPMGMAQSGNKLALACRHEIIQFYNAQPLAVNYPKAPQVYDALFMPRITHHTGTLDVHDIQYGQDDRLFAINTLFSCIMQVSEKHNFDVYWKPKFITHLEPEDRCHLNGMAMIDGLPAYVTAFNTGNERQSWRADITKTGVLIDVKQNEVICQGLAMPHTPRIFDNKLYLLLSASGELVSVDLQKGSVETVIKLNAFVRGMAMHQDYLFVGLSKLRKNSSSFAQVPLSHQANEAGIVIIHLPTAATVGKISYQTSVDEIYDVHVLPGLLRPNILNTQTDDHIKGITLSSDSFWGNVENE